jgi:TolA-binding protein
MSEQITIYSLPTNIYTEKSPILIKEGQLLRDPESGSLEASLSFKNISDKKIKGITVDVHVFDRANNELEVVRDYSYINLSASRDEVFGKSDIIHIITIKGTSYSIALKSVMFDDDTVFNGSSSLLYERIPDVTRLSDTYESEELTDQFDRELYGEEGNLPQNNQKIVPFSFKDLWICTCGAVNRSSEASCHICGKEFTTMSDLYGNRIMIINNLNDYNKMQAQKAEEIRLAKEAAEKKAAEEKAEQERLKAEEEARLLARKARNKKILKISLSIGIPVLIAIIIYLFFLYTYIIPSQKYNNAISLLNNGNYEEAINEFTSLGNFRDSSIKIQEALFDESKSKIDSGDYDGAIAILDSIPDYAGTAELKNTALFKKAQASMDSGNYDEAISIFTSLGDYENTDELLCECYYQKALDAISADDFENVKKYFGLAGSKYITILETKICEKGIEFYKSLNDDKANEYFSLATDSDSLSKINQAIYDRAVDFFNNNKFDEAKVLFTKLSGFLDSNEFIKKIYYAIANQYLQSGDFKSAIDNFTNAGDYTDAADKIKEATYDLAKQAFDNSNFEEAYNLFLSLGNYTDALTKAYASRYQEGLNQLNSGDTIGAYNTLMSIEANYEQAYILLITNSKFYIDIYDAGLGTNPQK